MKCPFCGFGEDKVIDSRPADEGEAIRRRRECLGCNGRFTTYEKIEILPLLVIKRDNTREAFSRDKVLNGLIRACQKRPVTQEQLMEILFKIEQKAYQSNGREISSQEIGETVMHFLKSLDEVAYVRFASVYRQFKDVHSFLEELNQMLNISSN